MGLDFSEGMVRFTPVEFGIGPNLGPLETRFYGNMSFVAGLVGGWGLGFGAGVETNLKVFPHVTLRLGLDYYYSFHNWTVEKRIEPTPEHPNLRIEFEKKEASANQLTPTIGLSFELPVWGLDPSF